MAPGGTRRSRGVDSAARLQALTRRAYTATAGHLDLDDAAGREFDRIVSGDGGSPDPAPRAHRAPGARRWAVSGRAVVVVLVVAAALAGVVVARAIALGSSDAVPVPQLAAPTVEAGHGSGPGNDGAGSTGGLADGVPPAGADGEGGGGEGGATGAAAGDAGSAGSGAQAGAGADGAGPPTGEPARVVVHVAGAVHEPGVVELAAGARVAEAVDAAGGALPEAELAAVNLARPVQDGEQVYVPVVGQAEPGAQAGPANGGPGSGGAGGQGAAAPGADGGAVVDLNTADLATLDTLPGVGPAIAERILQWRETHGPFHSVEELLEVSGIGPATLERLRDRVRV